MSCVKKFFRPAAIILVHSYSFDARDYSFLAPAAIFGRAANFFIHFAKQSAKGMASTSFISEKNGRIKHPMNAFVIWARIHRQRIARSNPALCKRYQQRSRKSHILMRPIK
ncbi:hypothetical protein XENTR_v10008020 [Xenopus tropicalis]|nr:hypothetical protein XENTR_v10008020 [Xenopus tropicalis]